MIEARSAVMAPLPVGWLLDTADAAFLYSAPEPLPPGVMPLSEAAATASGSDALAARYFQVACPYSLHLRPGRDGNGRLGLRNMSAPRHKVDVRHIRRNAALVEPHLWRHPDRPIVQIATPYRFIADEPAWLTQLPPFAVRHKDPWPGVLIGGRLPAHLWPRKLNWAFEWHDAERDLVLEAGEPWFYLKFEPAHPVRRVKMVEAGWNPALRRYCQGLDGVVFYVNRTFSLFETARQRRPKTLLTPVER